MQLNEEKMQKLTVKDLYRIFQNALDSFEPGSWHLAVFEGSPEGGLYSWCPDCIVASAHLQRFEKFNENGKAKLLKFKVGSREEWESHASGQKNPFKQNFPILTDIPTAILFLGKLDVFRIIAPQDKDLEYMLQRIKIYRNQIKSEEWHVPLRYRGPAT